MKLAGLAVVLGIFSSSNSSAEVPKTLVDKLQATAAAARFDGAILVGEPDGTSASFALGASPPAAGAIWRWASITKQLAAVIAMQEVERGGLDLDAPVARYWPEWRAPYAKQIRIRDLLLHNSGLPQPDESAPDSDGVPGFYRSNASPPSVSAASFCGGNARAKPPAKY